MGTLSCFSPKIWRGITFDFVVSKRTKPYQHVIYCKRKEFALRKARSSRLRQTALKREAKMKMQICFPLKKPIHLKKSEVRKKKKVYIWLWHVFFPIENHGGGKYTLALSVLQSTQLMEGTSMRSRKLKVNKYVFCLCFIFMKNSQEKPLACAFTAQVWQSNPTKSFHQIYFLSKPIKEPRNVTVCNKCPQRSLVRDTPSHYALSFCDVSLNLLQ